MKEEGKVVIDDSQDEPADSHHGKRRRSDWPRSCDASAIFKRHATPAPPPSATRRTEALTSVTPKVVGKAHREEETQGHFLVKGEREGGREGEGGAYTRRHACVRKEGGTQFPRACSERYDTFHYHPRFITHRNPRIRGWLLGKARPEEEEARLSRLLALPSLSFPLPSNGCPAHRLRTSTRNGVLVRY